MHEYSIAEELIGTLLDRVEQGKLSDARLVHLEIGELRTVSPEALSQAFRIVTEDTPLSGAELEYKEVPASVSCEECGYEGGVDYEGASLHFSVPVLSCPRCGGRVEIVEGRELSVESLTLSGTDDDD